MKVSVKMVCGGLRRVYIEVQDDQGNLIAGSRMFAPIFMGWFKRRLARRVKRLVKIAKIFQDQTV